MGSSVSRVARASRLAPSTRVRETPGSVASTSGLEARNGNRSQQDGRAASNPDEQHRAASEFTGKENADGKNEVLVANMQQAMAHPSAAIQFKEQLLPLDTDSAHTRKLIQQVEQEFAAMQSVFDRRTASEKIGGGRVSLEDMKALLGAIQAQRGQEAAVEMLASRFAVDPVVLRNVAKYYCIPRVKIVQVEDRPTMVAEWQ